jgi:hypothetical protein
MPHDCYACERSRPNERFSGRGHARHICRDCQRLPAEEIARHQALCNMDGFLHRQSRISERNIASLRGLAGSTDPEVAAQADALLRVAALAPGRKRRWKRIRAADPALIQRLVEVGLLWDEPDFELLPEEELVLSSDSEPVLDEPGVFDEEEPWKDDILF